MVTGLRCLVTGAASGIGRATAAALVDGGARVVGLDVAPAAVAWPSERADLRDEAAATAAVKAAATRLGGIDLLVNAAGIQLDSPVSAFDTEAFARMFEVNVRGPAIVTREALRHMQAGARIVNIASELAYLGRAGASGYCATKAAILSFTRSWARELAPDILVNAVAPGPIDTPLLNFAGMEPAVQALETANPLGRIGQPGDVAAAVLFLASPSTRFITGQCLSIDGGAAMH